MKIGFTGTRKGMTESQKDRLEKFLIHLEGIEFHHGECRGADQEAARIASDLGLHCIGHKPEGRASKYFLKRNREIVDGTDILIATPKTYDEELRSGTWATIRYARKCRKTIVMVFP